ncbi:hypothetical protein BD413DRAFT_121581 [Trametes elegans]|nr:hypothetical protein BD413DRAFT_121581 [Trametes elegans]
MVFSASSDKDHPRATLKARVQAALMPRRRIQSSSAIMPSAPQSECSTLVDFAVGDSLVEQQEEQEDDVSAAHCHPVASAGLDAVLLLQKTEDCLLDAENSAWSSGRYTASRAAEKHACVHIQYARRPETQNELLPDENTAWASSRPHTTGSQMRTRFGTSSHRPRAFSGVEMLDPEDRAWM